MLFSDVYGCTFQSGQWACQGNEGVMDNVLAPPLHEGQ